MSKPGTVPRKRLVRPGAARINASVFAEYHKTRQEGGPGRRRWFEDEGFDLVVWHGPGGQLAGFQLLYQAEDEERALTWREGKGFEHSRVDDGMASPLKNLSPILLPDGEVPWERLRREFAARAAGLEAPLREFVLARLAAGH